ncbi:MlaD family protein [Acuticoccus sp. MNP-M23]|uniref:MlaD family protein n=1 Tax=Acuticoccus sp. MNP-M23 TaxID=3072793 RepID=UPI002814E433|nr:MlaD family protein [Acuticoccus sp. MNP-M23]WMS41207.1 MlaD family protein [Acuticoccus sp. MNP-M23]
METRANYVAIGVFVVVVFAAIMGSLYWLYSAGKSGATQSVRIIFPEPTTGLSAGGAVLFNGIRVGEVVNLSFTDGGGDDVIAIIRVNPTTPIKEDTVAKLGFQGLTGIAYISLTGGSEKSKSLITADAEKIPTIRAETSAFTNVLDSAQNVLRQVNSTLGEVNSFLAQNRGQLDQVVENVNTMTSTLNAAAPQVSGLITDIASAGRQIAEAAPKVTQMVDRASSLIGAIEPTRVETIVTNVESFSGALPEIGTEARTVVGNVNGLITRLDATAGTLGDAVQSVSGVMNSLDQDAIGAIVANVRTATGAIAEKADALGTTLENAAAISADVRTVASTVAAREGEIGTALDGVGGLIGDARNAVQAAAPAIEQFGTALSAVTPARVEGIVSGVERVASGFSAQMPAISSFISSATEAAAGVEKITALIQSRDEDITASLTDGRVILSNLRESTTEFPALVRSLSDRVNQAGTILASVDTAALNATLRDARTISGALSAEAPNVGPLIARVSGAAGSIDTLATGIAEDLPQIRGIISDASGATQSARAFAEKLPAMADTLQPGIENVSAVLASVDAAAVDALVRNASSFAEGLAGQRQPLETLIARVNTVAETVAGQASAIGSTIQNAQAASASAAAAMRQAETIAADAAPALQQLAAAAAVVTPARVDDIVTRAQVIITGLSQQEPAITAIIGDVRATAEAARTVSTALAEEAPKLRAMIDDATTSARNVREASASLPGLVASVEPGVRKVGAAMDAIDPAQIEAIQRDAASFAAALASQREAISTLLTSASGAATRIEAVASAISQRMPQIGAILDGTEKTVDSASTFAASLPGITDSLQPGIDNVSAVLSSIDPEAVDGIVTSVSTFAETLAGETSRITAILTDAQTAARDASTILAGVSPKTPEIAAAIDSITSAANSASTFAASLPGLTDKLQPGIENLSAVLSSIDPAAVDGIVTSVRTFAETLAGESTRITAILTDAQTAARDASTILAGVSPKTPQIAAAIDSITSAANSASTFAASLPGLTDKLQPGIENVSAVLSSIDPAAVEGIVTSVSTFAETLAGEASRITAILTDAQTAARDASSILASVTPKAPQIAAAIDSITSAASSAQAFAGSLPGLATKLEPGIENIATVLSSIDATQVEAMVTDVRQLTSTLASQAPKIERIITSADVAAADAAVIAARLRGELDGISRGLTSAEAALADARSFAAELPSLTANLKPGLDNAGAALSAIDPEAITAIIDNVRGVSGTLEAARGDIQSVLATAGSAARQVESVTSAISAKIATINAAIDSAGTFAENLGTAGPQIDGVISKASNALDAVRATVAALNTKAINSVVENADRVAAAIGSRAGEIGAAIDNVSGAAKGLASGLGTLGGSDGTLQQVLDQAKRVGANLEAASSQISGIVSRAGNLLDGPVQGLVTNVSGAATNVSEVAASFASRADGIAGGLSRFSQGGLDDLRALLNQGRSTLSAIETAVSSFDRNPSRVIFGGSDGPQYKPQRR